MKKSQKKVVTPPIKLFNLRQDLTSFFIIILVWILIVYKNFSRKVNSAIFPDNESMTNALLSSMSRTLKSNAWPFWENTLWGGITLSNQPQLTQFYPFYFLRFANYSGTLNTMRTVHLIVLLHVLIFLLTSYFLLRVLKVSPSVSIAGSLIIVINQNTLGILSWISAIAAVVWIPTLIAGLILILRDRRSSGFYVFYGSVILIASAAPSHRLIFGLYLTLIFFIAFFFANPPKVRFEWIKEIVKKSPIPTLLFSILILPIFLPFFLDAGKLIRWIGDPPPGYVIGNEKIPYENFTQFQLTPDQLSNIFIKSDQFNAIGNVHIGIYALILLIFATIIGFRSQVFKIFFLIGIYSLLSSFGSNFGLSALNYQLPYLNKIREPLQFLTFWHLTIGVCISLGIQCWIDKFFADTRITKADTRITKNVESDSIPRSKRFLTKKSLSFVFLLITFSAQYANTPWTMNLFESSTYVYDKQSQLNHVFDRLNVLDPKHENRVVFDNSINSQIAGGLGSFKEVRTLQSYLNPAPVDLFEDMFAYDNRGPRYVDMLGIKYGVCKGCDQMFAGGLTTFENFRFIEKIGEYSIFENQNPFPYAFLLDSYQGVLEVKTELSPLLGTLNSSNFFAFLDSKTINTIDVPLNMNPNICVVRNITPSPNRRAFVSNCSKDSILVLNEHFTKNWKLSIDGKAIKSFKVNGVLVGAFVPKGFHNIEASYFPETLKTILNFTFVIFALLVLQILKSYRGRNRVSLMRRL